MRPRCSISASRRPLIRTLLLLAALAAPSAARTVDSSDASSFLDERPLWRIDYANDYFTASDRYYTEGIGAAVFHPALERSPLTIFLPGLPGAKNDYGVRLRQSTFTPSRLGERTALPNDRPWSAYLFLGDVRVSRVPETGLALVTEIDAGMIGPAAGGQTQNSLHARFHMYRARGWDNQIRNDVVLDYYARLEKTLRASSWGDFGVDADATAGTLYDNAALGAFARVGRLDPRGKSRFFAFARGEEKAVGYDATLQGGLFNRPRWVYTTPDSQVNRFVYRWDVGVALDFGSFAFEATRTAVGREFSGAIPHQWGEFSFLKRF